METNLSSLGDRSQYSLVPGGVGRPIVPKLTALLRDTGFERFWSSAASILGNIGDATAIPDLQQVLDSDTTSEDNIKQAQWAIRTISVRNNLLDASVRADSIGGSDQKLKQNLIKQLCRTEEPKDHLEYDSRYLAGKLAAHRPDAIADLVDQALKTVDPHASDLMGGWPEIGRGPAMALREIANRHPTSDVPVRGTWRLVDAVCTPRRYFEDRYTIAVLRHLADLVEPGSPLANVFRDAAPELAAEGEQRGDVSGTVAHMMGQRMQDVAAMSTKKFGPPKPRTWPKSVIADIATTPCQPGRPPF